MAFEALKKAELLLVAEEFGVELENGTTKPVVIAALNRDGVTWEMYKAAFPDIEDQPDVPVTTAPIAPVQTKKPIVLLKMTRENPTYEVYGYSFTRDNPFVLVDEEAANYILENVEGFHIASPKDAEDFYS